MTVSAEDVQGIAHLARIEITKDELAPASTQLNDILKLVEQLQAVETTDTQPMAHPLDAKQPLREDVVSEPDMRDRFMAIANIGADKKAEAGLYLVPKVIE